MTIAGSLTPADAAIVDRARPYTMTSPERIVATMDAVEYVVRRGIPGDFVECGVWRGGSILAMILTLQRLGVDDRDLHLFDTFEGMTEPTELDRTDFGRHALQEWAAASAADQRAWPEHFGPQAFGLAGVEALLATTGYPQERLHLVAGRVEDTIPEQAPTSIALLRLDTDWYESTRHELQHLYPCLQTGGVLIIDDYGHWEGARKAVDEYLDVQPTLLFSRTDYTGRMAVKH